MPLRPLRSARAAAVCAGEVDEVTAPGYMVCAPGRHPGSARGTRPRNPRRPRAMAAAVVRARRDSSPRIQAGEHRERAGSARFTQRFSPGDGVGASTALVATALRRAAIASPLEAKQRPAPAYTSCESMRCTEECPSASAAEYSGGGTSSAGRWCTRGSRCAISAPPDRSGGAQLRVPAAHNVHAQAAAPIADGRRAAEPSRAPAADMKVAVCRSSR